MPTHFDIVVVIAFVSCVSLVFLAPLVWMAWDAHRGIKEMQRMTKAVAGLVVQESDKIRELMRD
jgi:hypothetical protein